MELQLQDVRKQYGEKCAVGGISANLVPGEYGLLGANGAGKTTLIRLICGLQSPTSGEYILYGKRNTEKGITEARRRMGAVVETPSIYSDMTAEENIRQQYQILGIPSFDGIRELLELVGLEDVGKKKAKNFSLGMRQRLGIAVVLAGDPDFLILDEPANGLDPEGIIEMRELILRLNRERQITVLISSHILDELSRLATHYGFLDQGRMVKELSAQELESACQKCVRLRISDTKALSQALERVGLEYKIRSHEEADVYGEVNLSQLILDLAKEDCQVLGIQEHNESLESYFMGLVGGGEHE